MEKINNVYCIEGLMADSNSYLIDNTDSGSEYNYILVDTGTGETKGYLYSILKEIGIDPEDIDLIVNTHCHFDHVGGNDFFPSGKVAIHKEDANSLRDPSSKLTVSSLFGSQIRRHDVDIELEEGDKIANFEVLHTPGHSEGGLSLWDDEILICGDTIFANGGIGRMDIGGNPRDMKESLMRLKELDVEYLLPGHGPWVNNGKEHIKMSCMNMGIM
ncbi:Glyoxylase, beta-lactamase superfamily II [Methanobrevibacter olleyae]|uniref:Glyoxylase, beta-lactamase superfamily II n=1 Tax=Methanobrevibacter olleyae TaxID=294671 RepID=A0A1I4JT03_METOL|nr:Glyoxylase, beta-lactamase superfamily II [Methanobrevibacter olleyae]